MTVPSNVPAGGHAPRARLQYCARLLPMRLRWLGGLRKSQWLELAAQKRLDQRGAAFRGLQNNVIKHSVLLLKHRIHGARRRGDLRRKVGTADLVGGICEYLGERPSSLPAFRKKFRVYVAPEDVLNISNFITIVSSNSRRTFVL